MFFYFTTWLLYILVPAYVLKSKERLEVFNHGLIMIMFLQNVHLLSRNGNDFMFFK